MWQLRMVAFFKLNILPRCSAVVMSFQEIELFAMIDWLKRIIQRVPCTSRSSAATIAFFKLNILSRCSAVGSAHGLGP